MYISTFQRCLKGTTIAYIHILYQTIAEMGYFLNAALTSQRSNYERFLLTALFYYYN